MKATAKRRRSKAQIKDDKEREKKQKDEIQSKLLAWNDLEQELEKANSRLAWADSINNGINSMMDAGVLEQQNDGSFVAVGDPGRQEQIKSNRKSQKTGHAEAQQQQMFAQED